MYSPNPPASLTTIKNIAMIATIPIQKFLCFRRGLDYLIIQLMDTAYIVSTRFTIHFRV